MRLGRRNAERERQIQRYWDALVMGASPDDLARRAAPLDPSLVALVARVRATHQRRPPDPAFVTELERRVVDTFTRTQTVPIPLRPTLGGSRAAPDRTHAPGGRLPGIPDSRRRWGSAQLAAALLILAALVGVYVAFTRDTQHPAVQPGTAIPAPTGVPSAAPSVSMYRANPARTGEMPGPGPRGDPVELWRVQFQGRLEVAPAVVDGIVYLGTGEGVFVALDAATGGERWRVPLPDCGSSTPTVADGLVYTCSGAGDLVVLDAATGTERWRFPAVGPIKFLVAGGVVYVSAPDNTLRALDAATGTERWQIPLPVVSRELSLGDGIIYVAVADGTLHALDAATGAERWTFRIDGGADVLMAPVVSGGVVYLATGVGQGETSGQVYAVDTARGTERWRFSAPDIGTFLSPAVGGGAVYLTSEAGSVYALDAATGEQRWSSATGGAVYASPALAGDTLFALNDARTVVAFDAATGAEVWRFAVQGSSNLGPVVAGEVVYVGTAAGVLYAIGGSAATPVA